MSAVTPAHRPGLRSPLTRLFGRSNLVAIERRCDGCGKQVELAAYDAREWVALGPLPLFPLGAYRVFDDCPNCRRVRRLPRAEYDAWVAEEVAAAECALAARPDDLDVRLALVWQWYGLGRFAPAMALISVALLEPQAPARAHHAAGVLLAGMARPQEAADYLTRAVELQPDNPICRLDLARCLMLRRSSLALAEHHLVDAHRLAPRDLTIAIALAQVRCWRGEWRQAAAAWQVCEGLSPDGAWRTRHARLIARARSEAESAAG